MTVLCAGQLWEDAVAAAGGCEPDGDPFAANLQHLLDSIAADARLHAQGLAATRAELSGYLRNRLELEHWLRAQPGIAGEPIERPVFLMGLPRSGTTFLQNLFDRDPRLRLLRTWEARRPCPPPAAEPASVAARLREAQAQLDQWRGGVEDFDAIHLQDADGPDECTMLLSHAFAQAGFFNYLDVPDYFQWLVSEADFAAAYTLHRRQLQLLQWRGERRRWVLKYPNHLLALEAIRSVYPDAVFVFTHRDPARALASLCNLTWEFRRSRSDHCDRARVGAQMSAFVGLHIGRLLQFRAAQPVNCIDVDYYRLVAEPVAVVRDIYAALGEPMPDAVERRLAQWVAENPKGRRGSHHYRGEDFGLGRAAVEADFAAYRDRFAIPREAL